MGWLSDIFKRKPGGTAVGNILRSLSSSLTDGKLGSGANMISQQEYDYKNLSDSDFARRYGYNKAGVRVGVPDPSFRTPAEYAAGAFPSSVPSSVAGVVTDTALSKFMPWLIGLGVVFLGLIGFSVISKK